ncbi:post-GPI attachment to proteins factor 2-like [Amphiura filiformis]|uniref:post-GPI attachment to proteins factor 2-like n=1 Tax=Amphiura filiformis TaxID=82378 RepID=UPI003B218BC0
MAQYKKNGKTVTADDGRIHHLHSEYHPHESRDTNENVAINYTVTYKYEYAGFVAYTMLGGFGLSIMLAIIFRFEETTYTHCGVDNYLPSISAAIGTTPSAYVWRLAICMSSLPRLLFVLFCYKFYKNVSCQLRYYRGLCHLCFITDMFENLSLIGLSCISSDDNYVMGGQQMARNRISGGINTNITVVVKLCKGYQYYTVCRCFLFFVIHEFLFISFQVAAMLHMILMCVVFKMATTTYDDVKYDATTLDIVKRKDALQSKMFLCAMNILAFLISVYFFFRHQNRCETGVYSLFALFEYLVVVTNVLFHYDTCKDFSNRCIIYGHDEGREHNQ